MIKLESIFNEVVHSAKPKEPVGSGTEHVIYPSKRNPNIVYKVGKERTIEKWFDIFKKNPKYFPKVFKVGNINSSDGIKKYVALEKLDVGKATDEFKFLEDTLLQLGKFVSQHDYSIEDVFNTVLTDSDLDNEITNELREFDPKAYKIYIKWVNFLHTVNEIVRNSKTRFKLSRIDIHRFNFGYDSKGNLKCLDI